MCQGAEVPGRPGFAAEQHDLEAGPTPPVDGSAPTSTNDKQMDAFFESVATIKARCACPLRGCRTVALCLLAFVGLMRQHPSVQQVCGEPVRHTAMSGQATIPFTVSHTRFRHCALSNLLV